MLPETAAAEKMEPLRIQYHYDLGDLQEAQRALLQRWWHKLRVRLLIVLGLFALLIFLLVQMDPHSGFIPGFAGALLTIAFAVFGTWLRARKPAKNVWA